MSWRLMLTLAAALCLGVAVNRVVQDPETGTGTWDAARAAGFATYLLLWVSTVLGIAIHMRFRVPGLTTLRNLEIHRMTSALGLSFVAVHVFALLLDPTVNFAPYSFAIPFTTSYRPLQVSFGVVALWLLAVVLLSTALSARMPYSIWRKVHYAAFPCYLLALLHGLTSGSDSGQMAAILLYAVTAGSVAFLGVLRAVGRNWAEDEAPIRPLPEGAVAQRSELASQRRTG